MEFKIKVLNHYTKEILDYEISAERKKKRLDSLVEALKLTKRQLGLEGQGWGNCVVLSATDEDGVSYFSFPSFHSLKD
jgi:hypothetical protein